MPSSLSRNHAAAQALHTRRPGPIKFTAVFGAALGLALAAPLHAGAQTASSMGFLIYRVYLPADNVRSVPLPTLTFSYSDGRPSTTLQPCSADMSSQAASLSAMPGCAWGWVVSGGKTSGGKPSGYNVMYPDTASTYWVTTFQADKAMTITAKGAYPDARYMSFNAYDASFNHYEVGGVPSGLADFQIRPDNGSVNPWNTPGAPGGHYTVTLRDGVSADDVNSIPMPQAVSGGMSVPLPCTGSSCPPYNEFLHQELSGLFANVDNAYVHAIVSPLPGQVFVMRGKLPSTVPGAHPAPWPADGKQLRYWSACSNIYLPPYPVNSCVADDKLTVDAEGWYTIVASAAADRPANAVAAKGVAWLQNSALLPYTRHLMIVRNMLPNHFDQAIQNVQGDTAADARSTMQEYYPRSWTCQKATFEKGGWQACAQQP